MTQREATNLREALVLLISDGREQARGEWRDFPPFEAPIGEMMGMIALREGRSPAQIAAWLDDATTVTYG